jgi:hypothetical protein
MVISFESIHVEIEGVPMTRPIIPVHLLHRTDEDYIVAQSLWVDSGADFTLISGTIARQMDLEQSEGTSSVGGIGQDYKVRKALCDVILARGSEAYRFTIPVHVADNFELSYPLLGRVGVFDRFDVVFRQRNGRVEFHRKDPRLQRIQLPEKLRPR